MQEHVGKKRRKEVRQAIDMKRELNRDMRTMIIIMAIGILATLFVTYLTYIGVVDAMNGLVQSIPMIILLILAIFLGNRAYRWSGLREEYKKHCKEFNITKEDMNALKRGEL
ncbi:MAG: hypothetical protein ACOX69_11065 [Coriobacteriales bacterium]|jgi:FtsH-binding integral membrane protein